jgi:hypothetical protein
MASFARVSRGFIPSPVPRASEPVSDNSQLVRTASEGRVTVTVMIKKAVFPLPRTTGLRARE